jgi:hypothetical protein
MNDNSDNKPAKRYPMIEDIAAELMRLSGPGVESEAPAALAEGKAEIRRLARRDYGKALRERFSRSEVTEILTEGKQMVWPALNEKAVKLVSPKEFGQHWSALGLKFQFSKLSDAEGLSLLGFYVKDASLVGQQPLIWVNTAHHPAIVGAALDHEMGHHVVSQMFDLHQDAPQFLKRTGFENHLKEPSELAADILVSLGIYPIGTAVELFNGEQAAISNKTIAGNTFDKVIGYVADQYGLRFNDKLDAEKRFHALAALIHFTKLRRALLDEYDL